ncbi:amidase [Actinomadura kijaniata]|uniref:amidase n=1 Tax=Actinomadura kijaniata TaxID=46161 RepID=UPI003F1CA0F4
MNGFFVGRSLAELGAGLRSGRWSALFLVERALASIDPGLNAFAHVDAEGARAAARRADEEAGRGAWRGPLHGVPVAVKDLIDVAGLPCGMGSAHFAGNVPERDAACVRLLRAAGAVIVGMTVTHEFAYGSTGDVAVNGPVRNPHDRSRMSGGSSAGSAAAVASGAVPLALGTDTGGSVRIPAALCGVAGFKPPHGVLPVDGVFPLSVSLDHVGVLAGNAEDCRTAYRALLDAAGTPVADAPAGDGPRMAWVEGAPVDARVEGVVRAPFKGLAVERLDLAAMWRTFVAIQSAEVADVHVERAERAPGLYQPEVLGRVRTAAEVPAWRYLRALRERAAFAAAVAALLDRHDVLVMPAAAIPAPPVGEREGPFGPVPPTLISWTCPWNLLGLPALSVPAGTVDGLPVGVQFVTRAGAEEMLFTAARTVRRD